MRQTPAVLTLAILPLIAPAAGAITITFDYSHDTTGFFSDPARKAILSQAASTFTPFTDSLTAISPSGTNHWTASFLEPTNSSVNAAVADLSVPANTLIVFVGASDLPGSTLGVGGPGGYSYSGVTTTFANSIKNRGQTNDTGNSSTATDFARWGGAISFDSLTNWFFGSTTSGMTGSQADFLSVAIHELGHVLGFGTADSFSHYTSGTSFVGPTAQSLHSGTPVALNTPDLAHWANGTSSILPGTATNQETAMDPSITLGTRKLFTVIDYAGMKDIGWQVPAASLTVSLAGDTNNDGVVDLVDLNNVLNHFGAAGASAGDTNSDSVVDLIDLNNVLNHFGATAAPAALATVPEPAALSLLGLPAALILRRCRAR